MAVKADDRLPAKHMLITGGTGSGKTTYVKRDKEIQKASRKVLWDPDKSHRAVHIASIPAFARELSKAIKSGKKFNLALAVEATEENFQDFCKVIWAACCCTRPMVCVVEELAEVTNSGQARGAWKTLLNRSRKYGVQIVSITQRPQEIDKTTLTQSGTKVTGTLDRHIDRKRMAEELSVPVERIEKLRELNKPKTLNYLVLRAGQVTQNEQIKFR